MFPAKDRHPRIAPLIKLLAVFQKAVSHKNATEDGHVQGEIPRLRPASRLVQSGSAAPQHAPSAGTLLQLCISNCRALVRPGAVGLDVEPQRAVEVQLRTLAEPRAGWLPATRIRCGSMARDRGAIDVADGGLREAALHQRAVPVSGGSSSRAHGRQSNRKLSTHVQGPEGVGGKAGAAEV